MADYAPVYGKSQTQTLTAGAAISGGQALAYTGPDTVSPTAGATSAFAGIAGHDAANGAPVTVHGGAGIVHETASTGLAPPPAAPVLATAASGGTVLAGTYQASVSYVNAAGETTASATATITTTGATSTITIPSPPAAAGATGWYAYMSQVNAVPQTRQQAPGSPTAIGTPLVLTAPPINTGLAPPAGNTSGPAAGALVASAAAGVITGGATAGAELGVVVRGMPATGGLIRWKTTRG